ncbi:hypothetical protein QOZ80_9AG0677740 [Eleusine coracana subsp. coracana]|nr:hypothetical protein QOZ80_9AG0677740 [Eleusine coracana subsp. coracana]
MDENGDFKSTLQSDVAALLNLYEAAHLGKCDEKILSKAIMFTTDRLSSTMMDGHLPKPILERVEHALSSPTQRRMKRLEARLYMLIYENDEENNQDILELAKLDFCILQQMHRDEVQRISLWYKNLNPGNTLGGYIRDRPVECYFWALCIFYEPHYAKARMMFARLIKLFSIFDDTYDSYGTIDELVLFNRAIQSWDLEGAKQIGKCYAYVMSHLSNTFDELMAETGASPFGIECTKKTIKEGSNCMLQEVVWREQGQVPALQDYLKVSAKTTMYWSLASISFFGMDASDDVFTWTLTYPKIIESASIACRLMDDISGNECEKERSNCATAVDCYVREHGVTVQQAKKALSNLVEEQWKIINHEFLSNDRIPAPLLTCVINLVRLMETAYKHVDGYTHSEGIADPIHKLLNECVLH